MSARGPTTGPALAAALLGWAACGPTGSAPELSPIPDQVAAVSQELVVLLTAVDPDGDALRFDFEGGPDDLDRRARIVDVPGGAAEFRWTPAAADVGLWAIDFVVSDGEHEARAAVGFDVRPALGAAPAFIHPQGEGTSLDLGAEACLVLAVEVTDADDAEVALGLGPPPVDGALLTQETGTSGTLEWCPSEDQIAATDRYTLRFTAADGDHPEVVHPYLVVLTPP